MNFFALEYPVPATSKL